MTNYLNVKEILFLHHKIIEDFGGLHGVRDESRLLSCAEAPKQEVFGVEQCGDIYEKAAVYARNIIGDHPFLDGNKRTGITLAVIFLSRNGLDLTAKPQQLEDFTIEIATKNLSISEIAAWLKKHST